MAYPRRIQEYVERYIAASPELAERLRGYEIPDFFSRKRAEEELAKSHAELERRVEDRTAELTASYADRERVERQLRQASKLEAVGRLAGGISHDFNNLMGVVLVRADLLTRRADVADDVKQELGEVLAAARRAAALTQQLLAFSRVHVVKSERVDLSALVGTLAKTLLPLIGEDVELSMALDRTGAFVEADPGQLEQVVMNLVVNARDAMPSGGTLKLETGRVLTGLSIQTTTGELAPGRYAFLTVADTGAGMDEETLSKIFDPFFTTKPDGLGTGLGLSTVYGVVRQAGGGIDVISATGRGTAFTLYFPASEAERRLEPSATASALETGHELILIVEDQDSLRDTLSALLEQCGYQVMASGDPLRALELVEQHADRIDLLLTDVVMPKLSGPELARRALLRVPKLAVLFMSGYAPDEALRESVAGGEADFLQKPFLPEQLTRKIREILERKPVLTPDRDA
jgi:signal transduction histidine kinase/CheY-like chemotaxis protein